jgi:photosystem II stability/assembly factor-like uncharacterized protein
MKKNAIIFIFITIALFIGIQFAFAQSDFLNYIEKTKKELTVRNLYTIIETKDGDIYAGTWGAGIWKSTDFGNTWDRTSEGLVSYNIRKLITSNNSNRIFAATAKGLYYTDNGGAKWDAVNQLDEKIGYRNIVLNGNDIYVAADDGNLYKSQNDGSTWSQTGKINEPVITIPILISENKMLVGTENGLLISEDEGRTWVKGNQEINNETIKDISLINETLYITTLSKGIFISGDYGNSISRFDNGLQQKSVKKVASDAKGNVFATVDGEAPYSLNTSANTWQQGYSNISASSVEFISSNRNSRMSAITSTGEVLFSNDAGASWAVGSQLISAMPNTHFVELKASDEIVQSYTPPPAEFLRNGPNQTTAATINVYYSGFPSQAQAAFQYAVNIWASLLNSNVKINVFARYTSFSSGSTSLGRTWTTMVTNGFGFLNQPVPNTYYPVALANKLAGYTINDGDDMRVEMNSDYGDGRWYFGTDGRPGSNQYDFVSVVLHELCHGFGCTAGVSYNNGIGSYDIYPYIYDRFLYNGSGQALINFAKNSTALGSLLTSNNLYWRSPSVSNAKIYAPSPYESGSSISHLDQTTYSNEMMSPQIGRGTAKQSPGIALNQLRDMGWGLPPAAPFGDAAKAITTDPYPPGPLAFGDVIVGSSLQKTIRITNQIDMDIPVTISSINGAGYSNGETPITMMVRKGSYYDVFVRFSPTAVQSYTGGIYQSFSYKIGVSSIIFNIELTGRGVAAAPIISIIPNPIAFGDVNVGSQSLKSYNIRNDGNAPLVISNISINGSGYINLSSVNNDMWTIERGGVRYPSIVFQPTAAGSHPGTLTITHNASGSPTTINLTGNGIQQLPIITVSPTSLNFGNTYVGYISGQQAITIQNIGDATLQISNISINGKAAADEFVNGFRVLGARTPMNIAAGGSRNISVDFESTATGSLTGTITITHNASGSPTTINLTANGILRAPSITPSPLAFGDVTVNSSSTENITIKNTGEGTLQISNISISGNGFSLPNGETSMEVTAYSERTITVQFLPTTAGNHTGTLRLTHNANGSPTTTTINLTGRGIQLATPGITINPNPLNFGDVLINSNVSQNITIENHGTANLVISSISKSGNAAFTLSEVTTPITIAAGARRTITVQFRPTSSGSCTGTIELSHNASGSSSTINLTGNGTLPPPGITITPNPIAFGDVTVNTSSTQNITIQNTGNGPLQISSISINGNGFTLQNATTPITVAAGANRTITVQFSPTATTNYAGTITLAHNAGNGSSTISLTGNGIVQATPSITIDPNPLAFGDVATNTSSTQNITIQNSGTADLVISQANISGNGFTLQNVTTPITIIAGESRTIAVQFLPTVNTDYTATLTLTHNATGGSSIVMLTGKGVGTPTITITPNPLDFGNVLINTSDTRNITIQNDGNADLVISQATISGTGFTLQNAETPIIVAAGGSRTIAVQFLPTATTDYTSTITFTHNAVGGSSTVSLTGRGVGTPSITTTPNPLAFGDVVLNISTIRNITIQNDGNGDLVISDISISGTGFTLVSVTTPLVVTAGGRRTVAVQFFPTTTTSYTGTVTLTHNADSPTTVSLTGTGVSQATLGITITPNPLAFGDVTINSSSTQNITIQNNGTSDLIISQATISGTGFTLQNVTTPITVSAGGSRTIAVRFLPTVNTDYTGNITLTHNASGGSSNVSLTGRGVGTSSGITITPNSLDFGNVLINTSSIKNITIQNNGTGNLVISNISKSGIGFNFSGVMTPITVAAGGSLNISVWFAPTAAGSYTGTITLTHNASGGSSTINLTGSSAAPSITVTPNPLAFGHVVLNIPTTRNITIQNSGDANLVISQATITGTGFTLQNVTTPITIAASGSRTIEIWFLPTLNRIHLGNVTLTHNATGSPTTIQLSGIGDQDISVEEPDDVMGDGSTFLFQSNPNPVRSGYDASIRYRVNTANQINLTVYDVLGREIAELVNDYKSAGVYSVNFSTKGLPSGVYFYKLRAPGYEGFKKMVIVR